MALNWMQLALMLLVGRWLVPLARRRRPVPGLADSLVRADGLRHQLGGGQPGLLIAARTRGLRSRGGAGRRRERRAGRHRRNHGAADADAARHAGNFRMVADGVGARRHAGCLSRRAGRCAGRSQGRAAAGLRGPLPVAELASDPPCRSRRLRRIRPTVRATPGRHRALAWTFLAKDQTIARLGDKKWLDLRWSHHRSRKDSINRTGKKVCCKSSVMRVANDNGEAS